MSGSLWPGQRGDECLIPALRIVQSKRSVQISKLPSGTQRRGESDEFGELTEQAWEADSNMSRLGPRPYGIGTAAMFDGALVSPLASTLSTI
jgi:hypothetical protein